jgi:O-antigen/teichoic acid export membrane protein
MRAIRAGLLLYVLTLLARATWRGRANPGSSGSDQPRRVSHPAPARTLVAPFDDVADTPAPGGPAERRGLRRRVSSSPHLLLVSRGLAVMSGEAAQRLSQAVCYFLLASILSPREFGLAAVAFLTVQITSSLTYAGLGPAVQSLGPDERRDRTALALAIIAGSAGGLVLALAAPFICDLLRAPRATELVRLVAISLPLAQFAEVQAAIMERRGAFARSARAQYWASGLSASTGIGLALLGAGPFALVAQTIVQQLVRAVALASSKTDHRSPWIWRKECLEIWKVGKYLLRSGVMLTAYSNADNVTVSALSGAGALGGYGFVYNLANLAYYLVGNTATRVMLPLYTQRIREGKPLARDYEGAMGTVASVAGLPLGYLMIAGPTALAVLFGQKWAHVDVTLQILAVAAWLRAVSMATAPVLIAFHHVRQQAASQRWLLVLLIGLVIPMTAVLGTVGTAIAVTVPQLVVGLWLGRRSQQLAGASGRALLGRLAFGAFLGAASGAVGQLCLAVCGHSFLGLALSIGFTTAFWAAVSLTAARTRTTLYRPGAPRFAGGT